jgi:phosphotransacetylase
LSTSFLYLLKSASSRPGRIRSLSRGAPLPRVYGAGVLNGEPFYPRPLLITDAAVNVYPSLDDKRNIILNAIELAHMLGIANPKVAILSELKP